MLEREIERRLGSAMRKAGWLFLKWVSPGVSGVPDRIAISPSGRVTFVELKTETGHLSDQQEVMIRKLWKHGCECVVLYGMEKCMKWWELEQEAEKRRNERNGSRDQVGRCSKDKGI